MALVAAVLLILAVQAWIRLSPTEPDRWHGDPATSAAADCSIRTDMGEARAACILPGTPAEVLARLDGIAAASPRTTRLAGSPEEGRITWVTRSLVWGFPDYTTAAATPAPDGSRLDLHARLRFGAADFGVNAARLDDWLARLTR